MVKKLAYIFLLAFAIKGNAQQTALLDEIKLSDNYRDKQLIGKIEDSELIKNNSFLVRSTSLFQNLTNKKVKNNNKVYLSGFQFNNNFQNNTNLPISYNDGNLLPSKGFQERYSIGANIRWKFIDLNLHTL